MTSWCRSQASSIIRASCSSCRGTGLESVLVPAWQSCFSDIPNGINTKDKRRKGLVGKLQLGDRHRGEFCWSARNGMAKPYTSWEPASADKSVGFCSKSFSAIPRFYETKLSLSDGYFRVLVFSVFWLLQSAPSFRYCERFASVSSDRVLLLLKLRID